MSAFSDSPATGMQRPGAHCVNQATPPMGRRITMLSFRTRYSIGSAGTALAVLAILGPGAVSASPGVSPAASAVAYQSLSAAVSVTHAKGTPQHAGASATKHLTTNVTSGSDFELDDRRAVGSRLGWRCLEAHHCRLAGSRDQRFRPHRRSRRLQEVDSSAEGVEPERHHPRVQPRALSSEGQRELQHRPRQRPDMVRA